MKCGLVTAPLAADTPVPCRSRGGKAGGQGYRHRCASAAVFQAFVRRRCGLGTGVTNPAYARTVFGLGEHEIHAPQNERRRHAGSNARRWGAALHKASPAGSPLPGRKGHLSASFLHLLSARPRRRGRRKAAAPPLFIAVMKSVGGGPRGQWQ